MPYVINKTNGEPLLTLDDGVLDTSTSVGLVGRNYVGYGETQNENFIHLMENFANTNPPSRPIKGQNWFDTQNNLLKVYDGENWSVMGSAILSENQPEAAALGALWLKLPGNILNVYDGVNWQLIGPETVEGFGITRSRSTVLLDDQGNPNPVILITINDEVVSIVSQKEFSISNLNSIDGFIRLFPGFNLKSSVKIHGDLQGLSQRASRLNTVRTINGVGFNGESDIVIKSSTEKKLKRGTYLTGSDFDGSSEITWNVDATPENLIGKVVARDSTGSFSATVVRADLIGNVQGNINAASGTSSFDTVTANQFIGANLSGNARTATRLQFDRKINDVIFNGTQDITVPASAQTLTGNSLNSSVTLSNLSQVGTLISLAVTDLGISLGGDGQLRLFVHSTGPTIRSTTGKLKFDMLGIGPELSFIDAPESLTLGGPYEPAIISNNLSNLGIPNHKFKNVYALNVEVNSITSADSGNNIIANGNLIVTGNLTVQGDVTAVNSTELTIEDKLITLASGASTAAEANGAGIFINGSGASIMYLSNGDKWSLNKVLDTGNNDIFTTGLFQGTATTARYADLAENYVADREYEPGTVLEIGGEYEVTLAQPETNKIVGIVSTNPAYLMNSLCTGNNVVAVALQGRVPCKVTGKINKGDILVSAGAGFAKSTNQPQFGNIVGKSLENFDGTEGIIEVLVGRN